MTLNGKISLQQGFYMKTWCDKFTNPNHNFKNEVNIPSWIQTTTTVIKHKIDKPPNESLIPSREEKTQAKLKLCF